MAFDGVVLHQTIEQLNQKALTGRINKIYQVSKYELLIQLRANRKNIKLLLSCHPMYARMHLTNLDYPKPAEPGPLTMLFRKHLEGGYIKAFNQIDNDRICRILIGTYNDLGDYVEYVLFIEIMAKHSNIILCNPEGKIIDCLKRISPSMNTTRILQPGATYQLPPIDEKKHNPFNHHFIEAPVLTHVYQGISPILSREILYRIDQGQSFEEIIDEIKNSNFLYLTKGEKVYFHVIQLTHLHQELIQYSICDGLDKVFGNIDEVERIKQQTSNLAKFIQNEYTKNKNKLEKLQNTLENSQNADIYRIYGDLLFSYLHLLQKGMTCITVDNYFDNTTITIPLSEKLDGKQNALHYYNKYQKAKNSIQYLDEQIDLTIKEINYFDSLQTLLQNASYNDALEIKEELEQLGYIKKKTKKVKKATKPKFETYLTKDNIEICIGKNNLQNDYLTFKSASRYDMWFHAKDMPGSHVVVKATELDEYTIRLACNIASYLSKGKTSNSVPVSYTLVKNLKKPSGAKPGQVIMDTYKTLYIDPDDTWMDELKK